MAQAVCRDFLKLINGSLDIETLADTKVPGLNDVLENKSLTSDQKLQAIISKYSSMHDESEALKAKISELEKNPPAPVIAVGGVSKSGDQASNEKLDEVMKELTALREVKDSLEAKLKEAEKKLAVRRR